MVSVGVVTLVEKVLDGASERASQRPMTGAVQVTIQHIVVRETLRRTTGFAIGRQEVAERAIERDLLPGRGSAHLLLEGSRAGGLLGIAPGVIREMGEIEHRHFAQALEAVEDEGENILARDGVRCRVDRWRGDRVRRRGDLAQAVGDAGKRVQTIDDAVPEAPAERRQERRSPQNKPGALP